ncbi:MAG: tetratricopeptide repeat protein [Janthinobacterium lividum]
MALFSLSTRTLLSGALFTLLSAASCLPAQAQRNKKNTAAPTPLTGGGRLQPLYGGASPAQAQALVGPAVLADIDRSFPSRPEASKFFSTKGYEYLIEKQADTAVVRFNLAWVLDPKNPEAYRGLAVVLSQRQGPPAEVQALLLQGLAVAPTNSGLLTDATTIAVERYLQTKKKKDLTEAASYVQRAVVADATNANAWQAQARVRFYQEDYAGAWEAVHKSQNLNMSSLDFTLISDLKEKLPDPQGTFK